MHVLLIFTNIIYGVCIRVLESHAYIICGQTQLGQKQVRCTNNACHTNNAHLRQYVVCIVHSIYYVQYVLHELYMLQAYFCIHYTLRNIIRVLEITNVVHTHALCIQHTKCMTWEKMQRQVKMVRPVGKFCYRNYLQCGIQQHLSQSFECNTIL